jgi:diguanylate cyclase (GGDEF)-like protein
VPNRLLLNDRLTQAIAAAWRHRTCLAVLFVDVDHFKRINDSLGHTTGDALLKSIALRLAGCVRTTDTVCRHGGDEFLVLLSEVARTEDAALSAEKILAALHAPYCIEQQDLRITVSIGVSVFPDNGTDVETLVKNADVAFFTPRTMAAVSANSSSRAGVRWPEAGYAGAQTIDRNKRIIARCPFE